MSFYSSNLPYLSIDYPFTNEVRQHLKSFCNIHDYSKTNQDKFLVSYNKKCVNFYTHENDMNSNINTIGLLRSVVFLNGKLCCFSPPKSYPVGDFVAVNGLLLNDDIVVEEFVEGTMINVYFNWVSQIWEIATKNNIGGDNYFYTTNPYSFKEMFEYTCRICELNLNDLNKRFCYSFIIQHPLNNLINRVYTSKLYLIEVYRIEYVNNIRTNIHVENRNDVVKDLLSKHVNIHEPYIYNVKDLSKLTFDNVNNIDELAVTYSLMGYVIKNKVSGMRAKIRNPSFEKLQMLKGNQPDPLYQYLVLRKEQKLSEYLMFFPEKNTEVNHCKSILYKYTSNLYLRYKLVRIHKTLQLVDCESPYRKHVYKLHEQYINSVSSGTKKNIDKKAVIDYVNNLHTNELYKMLKISTDVAM
jgi:hypothetical protein